MVIGGRVALDSHERSCEVSANLQQFQLGKDTCDSSQEALSPLDEGKNKKPAMS